MPPSIFSSQTDVRVKAKRCEARGEGKGVVLWNDGPREELAKSLEEEIAKMHKASPEWWSWALLGCPPLALVVAAWRFWQNVQINKRWEASQRAEVKGKL